MNIVEVRHKANQKRTFWFEVPGNLKDKIQRGDLVICKTRNGNDFGVAQTGVLSGDGVERLAIMNGATLPLREIVSIKKEYPVKEIRISQEMKKTYPRAAKIEARLKEYCEGGFFRTNFKIGKDGYLEDGYTAYLVAKMLDLDTVPVLFVNK